MHFATKGTCDAFVTGFQDIKTVSRTYHNVTSTACGDFYSNTTLEQYTQPEDLTIFSQSQIDAATK